ncbi:transposase (plasmid) [Rhizobium sp. K1/93]|nr:transposase [Rhizobium sp. L58/93]MBO9172475.1 transposase [Rhizobium sp. L245/93]QXZ87651.1 transposase [Rhizobium sp. K1/93]QXZ93692.1 transposase [Rhizobium sp. K15/93]QYA05188.1 transposase [Rhizobium sp. B21/90]
MEYGLIIPQGIKHIPLPHEQITTNSDLPEVARVLCKGLLEQVVFLSEQIAVLEKELRTRARQDELASRLMTIPGVGPICATAIEALAPAAETFSRGRDFAAWIGLCRLNKTPPAARTVSAKFPRWGSAIFAVSSFSEQRRLSAGQDDTERLPVHGWQECF